MFSINHFSLYTRQSSILKNFSNYKRNTNVYKKSIYSRKSSHLVDLEKIKKHLIREKKKKLFDDNSSIKHTPTNKNFNEEIIEIILLNEKEESLNKKNNPSNDQAVLHNDKIDLNTKNSLKNNKTLGKYLFLPTNKCTQIWQSIVTLLLFYITFMLTYELTFIEQPTLFFRISEYTTSVIFFLDILFNFNLSYYKSTQNLVYSRKKIALNYLKFWFWMDIISAFPFYIFDFFKKYNFIQNIKTTKVFKYIKIVRLSRLVKYFSKIFPNSDKDRYKLTTVYMKNNASRLMKHLLIVLIISHFFACMFYLFPLKFNPQKNWVIQRNLQNNTAFEKYLFSMHWMIETVITVGYGEIQFR